MADLLLTTGLLNNTYVGNINMKLTPEEQERVARINAITTLMISQRSRYLPKWSEAIEKQAFYKRNTEDSRRHGKSHIRIPMELAFIESKTADEIETLPYVKVLPVNPRSEEDREMAANFEILMNYVFDSVINLKELIIRLFLKQKNTLGDGILKFYWCDEYKKVKTNLKERNGKITYEEKEINTYKDIKAEIIDLRNFLIDPIVFEPGKTLEDANYCGFFTLYEYEAFKATFTKSNGFKNTEYVNPGNYSLNDFKRSPNEQLSNSYKGYVEVYEHWDLIRDELVYIANGVEIRITPCPYQKGSGEKYLPIAHFVDHLSSSGFYNFGEVEIISDLIAERETQRNINIDAAKAYTHPWIITGKETDLDTEDFVLGINSVLQVNNPQDIQVVNMRGDTSTPFNLEQSNLNDAIMVTGHDVTGVIGTPGQTATQTIEKKESGIKRIRFINTYNEVYGFKRMYEIIKNLIIQYYTEKDLEVIIGKDAKGKEILLDLKENKKMLKKDYKIMTIANNQIPASRESQKQKNQELLATFVNMRVGADGKIMPHLAPLAKKVLEGAGIHEDEIEEILGKVQTPMGDEESEMAQVEARAMELGLMDNPNMAESMGGLGVESGAYQDVIRGGGSSPSPTGMGIQEQTQTYIQNAIK